MVGRGLLLPFLLLLYLFLTSARSCKFVKELELEDKLSFDRVVPEALQTTGSPTMPTDTAVRDAQSEVCASGATLR